MKMNKALYHVMVAMLIGGTSIFTSCSVSDDTEPDIPIEEQLDAADLTAYIQKDTPVNRGGKDGGTVALRFYEDMPNVPYISIADYHRLMLPGSSFTVTMMGAGQYALANDYSTATVDTRAETLISCGNLLPSLLKDQGVLLIGETSGGGSCCVQAMSTADGYYYQISSHRARLLNAAFENIDKGVTPHKPISDYPDFYNIEKLSQIVNDWYK